MSHASKVWIIPAMHLVKQAPDSIWKEESSEKYIADWQWSPWLAFKERPIRFLSDECIQVATMSQFRNKIVQKRYQKEYGFKSHLFFYTSSCQHWYKCSVKICISMDIKLLKDKKKCPDRMMRWDQESCHWMFLYILLFHSLQSRGIYIYIVHIQFIYHINTWMKGEWSNFSQHKNHQEIQLSRKEVCNFSKLNIITLAWTTTAPR